MSRLAPLPIDPRLPEVVDGLHRHGALLLLSPPGTGKTTRVPPALLDSVPGGSVVVLEPRRLAARAAARRVARECGCEVGDLVGYQVRNDTRAGPTTRIRFVTEGVLVRQLLQDPFLEGVACVVLDEFHERHLEADLALAMLQEVRTTVREDLKLLVMSATLDPGPLRAFLPGCAVIECESPLHDVATEHAARADDRPLRIRVREAVAGAMERTAGDVLVFLPGVGEIRDCGSELATLSKRYDCLVLPLHGRLDAAAQDRAIQPQDRRKVVLSTNVAESSVTIEGVTAVVDSGRQRLLRHDPARGLDVLRVERISLASAAQRRGRAGRTGPGLCLRLWTAGEERGFPARDTPEVQRVDLCGAVLQVRAFARREPAAFRWFEPPDPEALARADELLADLGALAQDGGLTRHGKAMLGMPVHPRLARVVLAGRELGCPEAAALAVALLGEWEGWRAPDANVERADLPAVVAAFRAAEGRGWTGGDKTFLGLRGAVLQAVGRLRRRLARCSGKGRAGPREREDDPENLARSLLCGFPDRVVRRAAAGAGEGLMVGGRAVVLPEAAADSELVLALAVLDTGDRRQRRARVGLLCAVEQDWLPVTTDVEADLDPERGRVVAVRRVRYRDLVLTESRGGDVPPDKVRELLRPLLERDVWSWFDDPRPLRALLQRVAWLRGQQPALDLPEWRESDLVEAALSGLTTGGGLGDLDARSVAATLEGALDGRQRAALSAHVPERWKLPSGRRAPVDYGAEAGPTVAARIQELFGCRSTPKLAGRPLVLRILAPNHRPVQVTRDLSSFWRTIYPEVRRELARRYPKHSWPEDPLTAAPEARPRRRPKR